MRSRILARLALRNMFRYPLKNLLGLGLIALFCLIFFATEAMAYRTREGWRSFFSRTFLGNYGIGVLSGTDKDYTMPVFKQPKRFLSEDLVRYLREEGVDFSPRIKQGAVVYDQEKGEFEGRLACLVGIDFEAEAAHQGNIRLLEGNRIPEGRDGVLVWREFARARGWRPGTVINLWIKDVYGDAFPYNFTVEGIFESWEGPETEGIGFWDVYPVILAPYDRMAYATSLDEEEARLGRRLLAEVAVWDPEARHAAALEALARKGGDEFWSCERGFGSIYGIVEAMYFVGGFIETVILLVFVSAMINLNLMSFFDRKREFGTMAAIGAKPLWMLELFLREHLLFCAAAFSAACALYIALCALGSRGLDLGYMNILFCGRPFKPLLLPESLPKAFAIVLASTGISLAYPAYLATALDPIEVFQEGSI